MILLSFVFLWLLPSFLVAFAGIDKRKGYWGIFFISLFFSPLIGLLVGIMPESRSAKEKVNKEKKTKKNDKWSI